MIDSDLFNVLHCTLETILFGLVMFFWRVCDNRFGESVDTSIHPNLGQGGENPPPPPNNHAKPD